MNGAFTTAPADTGTLTLAALPVGNPLDFDDFSGTGYIEAPPDGFNEDGIPVFKPAIAAFYTRITLERDPRRTFGVPHHGWFVVQMRRDQHGREWRTSWGAVVDDFGTLVEVAS